MGLYYFYAKRSWYVLLLCSIMFGAFECFQQETNQFYVVTAIEGGCLFLLAFIGGFALSNCSEIELCKCYGIKLSRLMSAYNLPIFFSAVICGTPILIMHSFDNLNYVYRIGLSLSLVISTAFLLSITAFIRVIIRNTYATVAFLMSLFYSIFSFHDACKNMLVPKELYIFDPILSAMMFQERWGISVNIWMCNRAFYLVLAITMYALAYVMVNRIKFEDYI